MSWGCVIYLYTGVSVNVGTQRPTESTLLISGVISAAACWGVDEQGTVLVPPYTESRNQLCRWLLTVSCILYITHNLFICSFAFNNKSLRVATVSVASNRFRTCFACTVAKVTEYFMSHPSSDLCTFSRSSAKFWQPANLTTYTILSLFSLHVEPTPHLLPP